MAVCYHAHVDALFFCVTQDTTVNDKGTEKMKVAGWVCREG